MMLGWEQLLRRLVVLTWVWRLGCPRFERSARLSILLELLSGERRVTDLVTVVGSSQSNVSNHLACLRECGLVVDRPGDRRQVFYSIAHPELLEVLRASERLLAEVGHDVQLCTNALMSGGRCDG
jgi:ArsR family transcriptional regulator, cadmium/lead-responsive transcriptional repressor